MTISASITVKPSCAIEKDIWINSNGHANRGQRIIKEDAESCWLFCSVTYPTAKYFEYCTENHPWNGTVTETNKEGKDLRKNCLCKLSKIGGGPNSGGSVSGDLTCGGFYMARLHQNAASPNGYDWEDGTHLKETVVDRGIKYEFDPASDSTSFKCTYQDGDNGIV